MDLLEFRAKKELNGMMTAQFADDLKRQVETNEKKTSQMERLFTDTLRDFNSNLNTLSEIANSLKPAIAISTLSEIPKGKTSDVGLAI